MRLGKEASGGSSINSFASRSPVRAEGKERGSSSREEERGSGSSGSGCTLKREYGRRETDGRLEPRKSGRHNKAKRRRRTARRLGTKQSRQRSHRDENGGQQKRSRSTIEG